MNWSFSKPNIKGLFILVLSLLLTIVSPTTAQGSVCKEAVETNQFRTDRTLAKYARYLTPSGRSLFEYFKNLNNGALWLDSGAGLAIALKQGLSQFPNLQKAIAIGVKKPEGFLEPSLEMDRQRFEYLEGYMEKLFDEGKLNPWMGRVDIITDVLGAFSYTRDMRKVLQIQLDLLAPGGTLFLMYYRDYNRVSGTEGKLLINWLKSIPGLEVEERKSTEFKQASVIIRKKRDSVIVPENLLYGPDDRGVPPRRHFIWRR
ncbi:MAG: hypothetical protein ACK5V3_12025 [Bdellovibrionales bacterium]